MTLPPQGHPQYELKRRIADCRERLRRTRTGQKTSARQTSAQPGASAAKPTNDEPTETHRHRRTPLERRARS